jgi:poly(hydroxyalkanoate) depolymerase family esterase
MKIINVIFAALLSPSAHAALVYSPPNFNKDAHLVVVIHGCLQSAESMALGTSWNQFADKNNLVVLYPQVPEGHPISCWGWYLPENQKAGGGQLKLVMDQIHDTKKRYGLKNPSVYVAGISSGAITAAGLLACFPNEFKAGAMHSGASYGLTQNATDAERILKEGPPPAPSTAPCRTRDYKGSLLVIHGSTDFTVNPLHANRVISDFSSATTRLEMVPGLGHAWAGYVANLRHKEWLGPKGAFPTVVPFFSELGPNSTQMMWDFFSTARAPNSKKKN